MRGRNSMAPRRIARLLYLDANNLYGWAMSQYLPTGGFRWLDLNNLPDIQTISPTAKRGSAWKVKLRYPNHLYPTHTEYPLCPECRIVKRQELDPHQNNDLIDKLSGGKFAETEKL
ncbi:4602_t:CDS:2, partial [Funneliformis geosporum]